MLKITLYLFIRKLLTVIVPSLYTSVQKVCLNISPLKQFYIFFFLSIVYFILFFQIEVLKHSVMIIEIKNKFKHFKLLLLLAQKY